VEKERNLLIGAAVRKSDQVLAIFKVWTELSEIRTKK